MKTFLITVTLGFALATSAFAQGGMVFFQNQNTTKIETNTAVGGTGSGANLISGVGNYYFALFYSTTVSSVGGQTVGNIGTTAATTPGGTTVSTNTPSASAGNYAMSATGWTLAQANGGGALLGTNTSTAGRFASASADGSFNTALQQLSAGNTAYFVVVGWSANIGSSVANLISYLANPTFNAWVGQSQVTGLLTVGNGGSTPTPNLFNNTLSGGAVPTFTLGEISGVSVVPEPGTLALAALGGASLLLFRRRK